MLVAHSAPTSQRQPTFEIPGRAELASARRTPRPHYPCRLSLFWLGLFCVVGALWRQPVLQRPHCLDWQAIQLWRIEWLLAAVAAFVAGCLLKK